MVGRKAVLFLGFLIGLSMAACQKSGDSQVIAPPVIPGGTFVNCVPGQVCNNGGFLPQGVMVHYTGYLYNLDMNRLKGVIKALQGANCDSTYGYGSFCFGGNRISDYGLIDIRAVPTAYPYLPYGAIGTPGTTPSNTPPVNNTFQVNMSLGGSGMSTGNPWNWAAANGALITEIGQYFQINQSTGSQVNFMHYRWRFSIVSPNTKLDGSTPYIQGVNVYLDSDMNNPVATTDLVMQNY